MHAARALDAAYCTPFGKISHRLMELSQARVASCMQFIERATDKETAQTWILSMMTLKVGSALCVEQQDWFDLICFYYWKQ